jgi:hypothetical protein
MPISNSKWVASYNILPNKNWSNIAIQKLGNPAPITATDRTKISFFFFLFFADVVPSLTAIIGIIKIGIIIISRVLGRTVTSMSVTNQPSYLPL